MCVKTEIAKFVTAINFGILVALLVLSIFTALETSGIRNEIQEFRNLFASFEDGKQIIIEVNE